MAEAFVVLEQLFAVPVVDVIKALAVLPNALPANPKEFLQFIRSNPPSFDA